MRTNDYVIVSASSLDQLQQKVQELMGQRPDLNWEPVGPPVYQVEGSSKWHQAMIETSEAD